MKAGGLVTLQQGGEPAGQQCNLSRDGNMKTTDYLRSLNSGRRDPVSILGILVSVGMIGGFCRELWRRFVVPRSRRASLSIRAALLSKHDGNLVSIASLLPTAKLREAF